jgi:hypothetical protein
MSFELLSERTRTAKKIHRCIWCGEHIAAGERYVSQAGKYEGDFQFSRFHPECHKAMQDHFLNNRDEDEFTPYDFRRGMGEPKHA